MCMPFDNYLEWTLPLDRVILYLAGCLVIMTNPLVLRLYQKPFATEKTIKGYCAPERVMVYYCFDLIGGFERLLIIIDIRFIGWCPGRQPDNQFKEVP